MSLFTTDGARPLGKGQLSPAGSVLDGELSMMLRAYKRMVAGTYRAIRGDELDAGVPPGPLLVSPKIDGELWYLLLDEGRAALVSPTGRVISGDVPVLDEAKKAAKSAKGRTVLAGELFAVTPAKARPRVSDVANALGGEKDAPVDRLAFSAFDVVLGGDAEAPVRSAIYEERLAMLRRLFDGGKRAQAIRTEKVSGRESVLGLFRDWVETGKGEGLVLRTHDNTTYKAKPTLTLDAAVIGFVDSSDEPEAVGSLLLGLMREDGRFSLVGACGNMPTETRKALYTKLLPTIVPSTYRHASSRGALFRFVRPETVVEVRVSDLIAEDSEGAALTRMVLAYEGEAYRRVRELPGVSILHPVLARVRDDKTVDATDVRFSQVDERVLVEAAHDKASSLVLPESTLLRREAYAKVTKGVTAVRKVLVYATNKHELDPSHPRFVVCYTDFSAGRKTPLEREVRLAASEEDAQRIADAILAENIKKGWERRS